MDTNKHELKPWFLLRLDMSGNYHIVARFNEEAAAQKECQVYEDKGHKQGYFVKHERELTGLPVK